MTEEYTKEADGSKGCRGRDVHVGKEKGGRVEHLVEVGKCRHGAGLLMFMGTAQKGETSKLATGGRQQRRRQQGKEYPTTSLRGENEYMSISDSKNTGDTNVGRHGLSYAKMCHQGE